MYDDATVIGNAIVKDDATLHDNARIFGCAKVQGNASVKGFSTITQFSLIEGNAIVAGNSGIAGTTHIGGSAKVYNANIAGRSNIGDQTEIGEKHGKFVAVANAEIMGHCRIEEGVVVIGNVLLCGTTVIESDTGICCPPLPGYHLTITDTRLAFRDFIVGKGEIRNSKFGKKTHLVTDTTEILVDNATVNDDIMLYNSGANVKYGTDNHYDIWASNKQKEFVFKY